MCTEADGSIEVYNMLEAHGRDLEREDASVSRWTAINRRSSEASHARTSD